MSLPSRSEYAVTAIYELSLFYQSGKLLSVQKIAKKYNLSASFLTQTLQRLREADLVETVRGARGGYRLLVKPEEITLGYVLALAEKPSPSTKTTTQTALGSVSKPKSAPSPRQRRRRANEETTNSPSQLRNKLNELWQKAEAKRQEYLNSILISDLISKSAEEHVLNFTI